MTPDTPIWRLVIPLTAMGAAMAFIWSPLAATATRNLPPQLAGAGSGVYNTTRQVGSVLGSAGMAALMASELSAKVPGSADGASQPEGQVAQLPEFLQAPFASAMSQAMLLPAFVALFGVIAALFLLSFLDGPAPSAHEPPEPFDPDHELYWHDGEDEYVEYEVPWDDSDREPHQPAPASATADTDVLEPVTEPTGSEPISRVAEPASQREWRNILDQLLDEGGAGGRSR